ATVRPPRSSSCSTACPRSGRSPTSTSWRRSTSPSPRTRRPSSGCSLPHSHTGAAMAVHKLVWFVPADALEATRDAVFAAGAGPAIGEVGREERVDELRVETVVPAERAGDVVRALLAAHPYEEVAFELYPLVEVDR